ncbi:MAG: 2OG-Fe(II) oxygenase [Nitrososphaeraceae archaeon]|nr:2OG-Fe(II) oxygenase [Nitrososphaeraceae archaeon]
MQSSCNISKQSSDKAYKNFVSQHAILLSDDLSKTLEKDYIVTVENFMTPEASKQVLDDIKNFKSEWWEHSILPSTEPGWSRITLSLNDEKLAENVAIAEKAADEGNFAYHFKRTNDNHYPTCVCYSCKLSSTLSSHEVLTALSFITGKKVTCMGETFASKYERDDFLTLHHDKNKGDYTFILSLSENWNPVHGGITHFVKNGNIYKSISPKFNMLTIFKLTPEHQMDHFVSRVVGPGERLAYTGWFCIEK